MGTEPVISVVILNYNGARWMKRCLDSLRAQSIFDQVETLVADNLSQDGSDRLSEEHLKEWPAGSWKFIQNGGNFGYCKGNNLPAAQARGKWLFFLNNDTWLQTDTLERLVAEAEKRGATAATPRVLDYDSDNFQSLGAGGFDFFGFPTSRNDFPQSTPVLMPEGCSYLILRSEFERLGGFDEEFFMYADELDLSWRVWLSGGTCWALREATLHHRGSAAVNASGGDKMVELRTSDFKRFHANRNHLWVFLKISGFWSRLLFLMQCGWLIAEGLAGSLFLRRFSFFRNTVWAVFKDCRAKREHLRRERARFKHLQKRSFFWMLRHFLRLRLNRWDELMRIRRLGLPKVTEG